MKNLILFTVAMTALTSFGMAKANKNLERRYQRVENAAKAYYCSYAECEYGTMYESNYEEAKANFDELIKIEVMTRPVAFAERIKGDDIEYHYVNTVLHDNYDGLCSDENCRDYDADKVSLFFESYYK